MSNKFCGNIGFKETLEIPEGSGIYRNVITEKGPYYGDILKNYKSWQTTNNHNDDSEISNTISIVSDPYALNAIGAMKYVVWLGQKFKIKSISVEFPRLVLTIGGLYNGQ